MCTLPEISRTGKSRQTKKNFERGHVISLITLPQSDQWLFAGAYESHGCNQACGSAPHRYNLQRLTSTDEMNGRLIVEYERDCRNSYRKGRKLSRFDRIA